MYANWKFMMWKSCYTKLHHPIKAVYFFMMGFGSVAFYLGDTDHLDMDPPENGIELQNIKAGKLFW